MRVVGEGKDEGEGPKRTVPHRLGGGGRGAKVEESTINSPLGTGCGCGWKRRVGGRGGRDGVPAQAL